MTSLLERFHRATHADDLDDSDWFGAEAHVVIEERAPARPSPRTIVDDLDDPEWFGI